MALSDHSEQKFNDWRTGKANMPATTTRYFAAFTVSPGDSNGGTEVSGNGYARVAVTTSLPSASGAGGTVTSSADISFPAASGGNWGAIVSIGSFDASTAGNLIEYKDGSYGTINNGNQLTIPSGSAVFTAD